MREILFRGKRTDNGEWVEGYLFNDGLEHSERIFVGGLVITDYEGHGEDRWKIGTDFYEVIPETVGQYTGLTDKNGKKIFEGDIVKTHYQNTRKNDFVEQVVFHNGRFCTLYEIPEGGRMWANLPDGVPYLSQVKTPYIEWCEVIGNIHDNPDLLKGEQG